MSGATALYKCRSCGDHFTARTADRARGWARFCSKSCKAIHQTQTGTAKRKRKPHDGVTEMKWKRCTTCGEPAINGVYRDDGSIEWGCALHHDTTHPFSSEALDQWQAQ